MPVGPSGPVTVGGRVRTVAGAVGSVVVGGLGTLAVAWLWRRWFPALATRDALVVPRAG